MSKYEDDLWFKDDSWQEHAPSNGSVEADSSRREYLELDLAARQGRNVSPGDIERALNPRLQELNKKLAEYDSKSKIGRFIFRLKQNLGLED